MTRWSIMPSSEATLSEITMKARATTNIADDNARSLHIKIRRGYKILGTEKRGSACATRHCRCQSRNRHGGVGNHRALPNPPEFSDALTTGGTLTVRSDTREVVVHTLR